jgi:hypothetical protein
MYISKYRKAVMKNTSIKRAGSIFLAVLALMAVPVIVSPRIWAVCNPGVQTCSTSYGVDQALFGTGGELNPCSATYCSKQSAGETAVGNDVGTAYQAQAGFNVNRDPSLTFIVGDNQCPDFGSTSKNVGKLSTLTTSFTNINFSVKSYLASGYVVQTKGSAPIYTSGTTHTLAVMSGGTSTIGTEQFGINLKQNTTPAAGNNPSQLPDATFSFGQASAGYNTADHYSYANGAQIAASAKSSGTSCYDITYIFNISNTTPAGLYTLNQTLVATSTF